MHHSVLRVHRKVLDVLWNRQPAPPSSCRVVLDLTRVLLDLTTSLVVVRAGCKLQRSQVTKFNLLCRLLHCHTTEWLTEKNGNAYMGYCWLLAAECAANEAVAHNCTAYSN